MNKTMVDAQDTYTLEHQGKFYIIEHVPARACQETGEQYFSPETVEHIQGFIKAPCKD
jgi:YgiT-type zinc finger domain-containing protein